MIFDIKNSLLKSDSGPFWQPVSIDQERNHKENLVATFAMVGRIWWGKG
jgi:hypothetical protein